MNNFILKELSNYPLGTFAEVIYRNSRFYPDKEAFVMGNRRVTFSEYNNRVNRLIHALLAAGYRKGDVIGILSWNCIEYMEVWGAAMKAGFILAHFSPRLSENELLDLIPYSQAKVIFSGPEFADMTYAVLNQIQGVDQVVQLGAEGTPAEYQQLLEENSPEETAGGSEQPLSPEDPLTIFFTSGTTGIPKGALYSHRSKMENATIKALDLGAQAEDRNLIALPMFHIGGDSHIWPFFLVGACNVIMEEVTFTPPAMLETLQNENITDVQIVATQLVALLENTDIEAYDLKRLRRIWYAASPMPTEILKRGIEMFGPIFMQGYGMSESGPHTTILSKEAHIVGAYHSNDTTVLNSCGRPAPGVQIRIVDLNDTDLPVGEIGEIIIRSDRIMSEYWQQPEATGETIRNGWLYTGDLGYYDENGYVYIADRKKDMIITGGENVFPKEVEEILYQHPDVYEAAVIGVPDPYWVERVHAMVVLKNGAAISDEEIMSFCKDRMARFKSPKSVEFMSELPKSPQGKVLKKELRKIASQESAS